MDLSNVKRIHTTCDYHQANMLLRCNWILLEVKDGRYTLGQIEKFRCPKCNSDLDFDRVHISSWEGLHMVDCPECGEHKIPFGLTLDEYFADGRTEYTED